MAFFKRETTIDVEPRLERALPPAPVVEEREEEEREDFLLDLEPEPPGTARQRGAILEERAAVLNLMEVLKNCLKPVAVRDLTFKYQGACREVDVEIYTLSSWWFGGWTWFDAAYDLQPGESFVIDGSSLAGGVLTDRIMMRIYDANYGKLLDTIYVRTSGEWFLEVEPGNIYGAFEI